MNETVEARSMISVKEAIYLTVKRMFDILVGLLGIVAMIPIILVVKVSNITRGDFHSIFFTQKRIGKNGKEFKLYKFRSMVYNAEDVLKELLKEEPYKTEWKLNQKLSNDPRITKVGQFLRKTSLDEVPQFINVLLGDMSLIGPRPLVPGELDEHNGDHDIYEKMRPGITGWWASNGRSDTTYEERLKLEYYYINNCSIMLDIKCIWRTIKAVLFKKGAK